MGIIAPVAAKFCIVRSWLYYSFFFFFCSITNCFKMDVAVNIELFFNFTDSRVLEVTILSPELANE